MGGALGGAKKDGDGEGGGRKKRQDLLEANDKFLAWQQVESARWIELDAHTTGRPRSPLVLAAPRRERNKKIMREQRREEALNMINEASKKEVGSAEEEKPAAETGEREGAKLTAGGRRRMLKEGNLNHETLSRTRYDREYQQERGLDEEAEFARIVDLKGMALQSKHRDEDNQREIERLKVSELDPAFGSRIRGRPTPEEEERLGLLTMREVNEHAKSKERIDELRKVCFRNNSQVSVDNRKTAEKARSLLLGTSLVCKMSIEEMRQISREQGLQVTVDRKEQGLTWTEKQRMGTEVV